MDVVEFSCDTGHESVKSILPVRYDNRTAPAAAAAVINRGVRRRLLVLDTFGSYPMNGCGGRVDERVASEERGGGPAAAATGDWSARR